MSEIRRRIRFVETLGQGGFGAVYLADVEGQAGFQQRLAVKLLSAELNENDDIAARQRDEARLLAQLNHHAIVKVFDLITIEGRPAVLMEYVEGVDAAVLCDDGPLPPRAALQLLAAAADALHVAYTTVSPQTGQPLAVIHRDIKPANLLVSRHGGVKVLDFGIARADFAREGVTGSVQYGSARYMAPEQWLHGVAEHPVDIYALGVSAVELLTGSPCRRAPLGDDHFDRHISETLAAIPEDLPLREPIAALLCEMMRFHPEERPGAAEVSERMLALSDGLPGEGLSRYARRRIPPLILARRSRYEARPLPGEISFYQEISQSNPPALPMADPSATMDRPVSAPLAAQPPRWILPASALLGLVMILGLVGIGLGLKATVLRADPEPTVDAPVEPPIEAAVLEEPEEDAVVIEPVSAAPVLTTPSSRPPPEPEADRVAPEPVSPTPEVQEEPVTAPPEPEVVEEPAVETRQITFGSQKGFGTQVFLDDRLLGTTPLTQAIPLGVHRLRMVHSTDSIEDAITVGASTASNYTWKLPVDRIHGSD